MSDKIVVPINFLQIDEFLVWCPVVRDEFVDVPFPTENQPDFVPVVGMKPEHKDHLSKRTAIHCVPVFSWLDQPTDQDIARWSGATCNSDLDLHVVRLLLLHFGLDCKTASMVVLRTDDAGKQKLLSDMEYLLGVKKLKK